ncbi:MAG TPA: hypothetical protein VM261_31665 [Kofleriaceae bacterium]|nr:hypothetical protein [Kofleriaceae bacterium]
MSFAGRLLPVVIPVLAASCQFADLPEIPTYTLTVSAEGVWAGADIEVRVTPDRGDPQTLTIDREGSAAFPLPLEDGTSFVVEVEHGDLYHSCTVAAGEGTVAGEDHSVSLRCTSSVPIQVELSTPGVRIDLQRTRQMFDVSDLQQRVTAIVDGPPGTAVRVDGVNVALASRSPSKPLEDGRNDLVVAFDVASLGLSRTFTIELDRGAAFATEDAFIKAGNIDAEDRFGHALVATDAFVAIGAPREDGGGYNVNPPMDNASQDAGAVYVYRRSGQGLVTEAYLKGGGSTTGSNFGASLAATAEVLVVGSPKDSFGGPERGSATVFRRAAGLWQYEGDLRASDATDGDQFGFAVAVHGDVIAVAAWTRDVGSAANQGAIYIFRREGGAWSEIQRLAAPGERPGVSYGYSLALSDSWLVVGSSCDASSARGIFATVQDNVGAPCAGGVYAYRRSVSGWELDSFIKASNADASDSFGESLAIQGDTLVVGAPVESSRAGDPADNSVMRSGAAYVFAHHDSGWTETAILKAAQPVAEDYFGESVALKDGVIAIGGTGGLGAVELFQKMGGVWNHADRRLGATYPDGNDQFGGAVALFSDALVVGALFEDGTLDPMSNDARNSGAVYFFR